MVSRVGRSRGAGSDVAADRCPPRVVSLARVTVATIAQRLRDDHHVDVSESTVRRYIANAFTQSRLEDKVTVTRGAVEPGSGVQIDYGRLGMWLDPDSGRRVAVCVSR